MNIQSIILFLITGVLFISCTKEEINNPSEYKDGDTTRITLTLKSERQQLNEMQGMTQANCAMQFPYNVPTTANMIGNNTFSPKDESLITNVHILVFNSTGQIVSNTYINKLNFSETAKIITETYCGENMDVWVVTNGDVNDTEEDESKVKLEKVKNVNDLQAILISTNGDGLSRSDRLTMVGNTTITITPNMAAISIQMHYLAAKVTVKVNVTDTPNDVAITITGWDVVNIPKRTYLKEHTKEDAVSGTESTDYLYSAEEYPFETIGADTKTWAQSFYLFENRRGGRIDRTLPTNPAERYPNMTFGDTDPRGKAWFAPPGATYMLIYGTYNKSGQMNNVVYKIYLGENAYNNYDVVRGKHYTFNVTIKGLNQIDIDTTVDWGNSSFTVTPYGDLEKMDAHPDFRVLRIGATAVDATTPGYATVEVLNSDNSPCQWLSVSPLNLYRYGIKQQGNTNQPFADAVGCFVRTKYDPIVADELSFNKATFGMTRKLTEIPFPQLAVFTFQDVVIYADSFNDTGERTAKVRVTYYKDENGTPSIVGQQEFDVAQQDAIKITNDLYIERYEEFAMTLYPDIPVNLQKKSGMQWGYTGTIFDNADDRFINGNYLTANAVYTNVEPRNGMNTPQWEITAYAAYREKYPNTGGKVTEPTALITSDTPYYYPQLANSTTDYFDPIYSSSAARYCHEKNRDTNGDGIISKEETIWYLPSYCDMDSIMAKAIISGNNYYWTATEVNANESFAFTISAGKYKKDKVGTYRVRCVRGSGVATMRIPSIPTNSYDFSPNGNLSNPITINADLYYGRWTLISSDPTWLKIGSSSSGGNEAASQSGVGYTTLSLRINEANTTGKNRVATVTLKQGDKVLNTCTVTQRGIPLLTVDKTSFSLPFLAEESRGFNITAPTRDKWTATSDQSWLKIATSVAGAITGATQQTGTESKRLYVFTTSSNPSTSATRKAKVTITRDGIKPIVIEVIQGKKGVYEPAAHSGWASSNIYYFDGMAQALFFMDNSNIIYPTVSYYQGVLFYWGSLVATSPVFTYNNPDIIQSPPGVSGYPRATAYANTSVNRNQHHVLEQHNPSAGIGDICRYMTARGMAPGSTIGEKWRLPTCADFEDGSIINIPLSNDYALQHPTNIYGMEVIAKGALVDPNGKICFPANGWFGFNSGSGSGGWYAGYCGTYMSGTSAVDPGIGVVFHYNTQSGIKPFIMGIAVSSERAGVRCVRESKNYD